MEEGEWLYVPEAAERLRIGVEGIRWRVSHARLKGSRDNKGRLKVWVTKADTEAAQARLDQESEKALSQSDSASAQSSEDALSQSKDNFDHKIKALETILGVIRKQLTAAEARADCEREERLAAGEGSREERERLIRDHAAERERLLAELKRAGEDAAAERNQLIQDHAQERDRLIIHLTQANEIMAADRAGWQVERQRLLEERAQLLQVLDYLQQPWWRRLFGRRPGSSNSPS